MNNTVTKNEILKYKKLLQKKYRQEQKLFIIEGKHIIDEALKINNLILLIITSDKDYVNKSTNVKYCTYDQICQLSTTKNPQQYVAICKIFESNQKVISNKLLILNKINDPGNLGTLIRTAASFGCKDVIVEGVDIYNPKVLRSTQGAIFNLNIFNVKNIEEFLLDLKSKKFKLIGSLLEGASDYNKVEIKDEKIAIILGNEANGIDKEIIKILDYKVYIPIKFESLNVAVAGGILLAKYFDK